MKLEQLAKILGYAGLIPFITFSLGTWFNLAIIDDAHFIVLTYAAVILSFMGAIHWGVAMSINHKMVNTILGLSVIPALLGWLALLIPMLYGYGLLIFSFIILYWADKYISDQGMLPGWYLPMRLVLTSIVVLSLLVSVLSVIII